MASTTEQLEEKKREFLANVSEVLARSDQRNLHASCNALLSLIEPTKLPELSFAHKSRTGRYSVTLSNCRPSLDGLTIATAMRDCDEHLLKLDFRPGHGEHSGLIQTTMVMLANITRDGRLRQSHDSDPDSVSSDEHDDIDKTKAYDCDAPEYDYSFMDAMCLGPNDMILLKALLTQITQDMDFGGGPMYCGAIEHREISGFRVVIGPFLSIDWTTLAQAFVLSKASYNFSVERRVDFASAARELASEIASTRNDARMWVAIEVPRATKRKRTERDDDQEAVKRKRVGAEDP